MAKRLWDDFDGEPFLINPHLGILNPKKRGKKTMARRTARRRVARTRARRRTSSRRRTYRANPARRRVYRRRSAPVARRRTRRRTYRRNPVLARPSMTRRRRYQRNPKILGLELPSLKDFLFTGIGFAAAPGVEGFVSSYLPTDITANTAGRWAVKLGTVGATAWAVRQFVGRTEGNRVLLGGAIYLMVSAIKEFAPGMVPGLGAYVPNVSYRGGPMLARRNGMGSYTSYRNLGYPGAGVPTLPNNSRRQLHSVSRFSRF